VPRLLLLLFEAVLLIWCPTAFLVSTVPVLGHELCPCASWSFPLIRTVAVETVNRPNFEEITIGDRR